MKREQLQAKKRSILGKKVKKLRREGLLPANIYGKDFTSTHVEIPMEEFAKVYKIAKETALVDVVLDGKTIPVLIKNVQMNPKDRTPLHADFHKVNLKEKITAQIPLEAIDEAPAVLDKKGDLLQALNEIEVEALPTDLPEKIEISIANLKEIDDQVTIADITTPANTTILTDPTQVIFKITEFAKEEVVETPPPTEGEEGEAQAAAEGEGTPAESEKAEKPQEEKKEAPKEEK